MKVSIHTGTRYSKNLENGNTLEVSIYPSKWFTEAKMSVWTEEHDRAVKLNEKIYPNYDKFLPLKLATKVAKYKLNKQSQKIAGVDIT